MPPPHVLALMKASVCHVNGDAHGAQAALGEAASMTPPTAGTITRVGGAKQRFSAISDSDELTGATLPVYDGNRLLDLAFSELSSITFHDPKTSFDVMWSVADIEMVDGTRLRGRVPSFYAGTGVAADKPVRTGQMTTWQRDRGYAEALGQRDWSVTLADGGRSMVGILGVQRIDFDNPRRSPGHQSVPAAPPAYGPQHWGPAPQAHAAAAKPKQPGWLVPVGILAGIGVIVGIGLLVTKRSDPYRSGGDAPAKYEPPPRRATSLGSYADLCDKKDPFPGAKKYAKSKDPTKPSKVALFHKYLDNKEPKYDSVRPDKFIGFATEKDNVDDVELVACVDLKRHGKPSYCTYYGASVEVFDMTHTLRIIEATTGKVVKEETFELDRHTEPCPGSVTGSYFTGADYIPKVVSTLLPFEPDGIQLPKAERSDLDSVCSGSPVPSAAPYKPGSGKRNVHLAYFPTTEQGNTRQEVPDNIVFPETPEEDVTKYELVACIKGVPKKKKAECDFTSGKVLEMHDGEFEVSMFEAATGKLVEKKTFKGTSSGVCPFSYKFYGDRDKIMQRIEPAYLTYMATMTGEPAPKPKPAIGGGGGWSDRLD
jgi:hypothetical protein